MATINVINHKSQDLTIDPGASGDSFLQFDINTTGEFRIGVDDTDDSFRISQGSALGTTDTLIITDAGERTLPLQPAFAAYLASDDNNVTGDGTRYILGTNTALTEIYDINSDFNTNGTFTAPITGKYLFFLNVKYLNITTGINATNTSILTSNRKWKLVAYTLSTDNSYSVSVVADLDASDTTQFEVKATGVGADTSDIDGSGSPYVTHMSGYLIT